eukprot:TRINITY_DN2499_c0_g1_i1.p1 TRINITY_DN2499_c0_g1~~TRINITY_DN2499_c0_g1_i1.p1  ORF type:complete len:197 (-),score=21.15 TRINITY_DN2499_c0_g1_i1:143-670(-)
MDQHHFKKGEQLLAEETRVSDGLYGYDGYCLDLPCCCQTHGSYLEITTHRVNGLYFQKPVVCQDAVPDASTYYSSWLQDSPSIKIVDRIQAPFCAAVEFCEMIIGTLLKILFCCCYLPAKLALYCSGQHSMPEPPYAMVGDSGGLKWWVPIDRSKTESIRVSFFGASAPWKLQDV